MEGRVCNSMRDRIILDLRISIAKGLSIIYAGYPGGVNVGGVQNNFVAFSWGAKKICRFFMGYRKFLPLMSNNDTAQVLLLK